MKGIHTCLVHHWKERIHWPAPWTLIGPSPPPDDDATILTRPLIKHSLPFELNRLSRDHALDLDRVTAPAKAITAYHYCRL